MKQDQQITFNIMAVLLLIVTAGLFMYFSMLQSVMLDIYQNMLQSISQADKQLLPRL